MSHQHLPLDTQAKLFLAFIRQGHWNAAYGLDCKFLSPLHKAEATNRFAVAILRGEVSLGKVPDVLKTPQMCLDAVRGLSEDIYEVPEDMLTREMLISAATHSVNPIAVRNLPVLPGEMTAVALAAVHSDGANLAQVPRPLRTREVCLRAIASNRVAFQSVPDEFKEDEAFLREAVQANGEVIIWIHSGLRESGVLDRLALQQTSEARHYMGGPMMSDSQLDDFLAITGKFIDCLPPGKITPERCRAAVEQDPLAFTLVPTEMRTQKLADLALAGLERLQQQESAVAQVDPEENSPLARPSQRG